jgi:predicted nucleic acid-binding protein
MKIVVDTNIVFSCLLNSNSRIGMLLLDTRSKFEFYSCKYLQKEIYLHIDKIRQYSKLNDSELFELLNIIESHSSFIDENLLPAPVIEKARSTVADIDFDDFAFVALASHLDALLWTGDKKLSTGLQRKGYNRLVTTSDLFVIVSEGN